MILFIKSISEGDWDALYAKSIYLMLIYSVVLLAVIIDTLFGLYKAKKTGVRRTSDKFSAIIDKLLKYFAILLIATCLDLVASIVIDLPYFTAVVSFIFLVREIWSIFEKYEDKEKKEIILTAKQIAEIAKARDLTGLPDKIQDLINKTEKESDEIDK